ncbi:MAG: tyrosine-type recombinase/integrase [Pseudomonadota bacterium]
MGHLLPTLATNESLTEFGQPLVLIAASGSQAERRFWEFFTVTIRNRNTRAAYARAAAEFCAFLEGRGVSSLTAIQPIHVAAYVEVLGTTHAPATVKQRLAALRMLFDWLVVGQVLPVNPTASVRGPRHVVKRGKTPVLERADARLLLESIDTATVVGLRDRAFIGLLVYSFARVGAAVAMEVGDFYANGRRWWVRLKEKGGKHHELPAHHNLEAWLHDYLQAAWIGAETRSPLFRSALGRTGRLSDKPLLARNALDLVQRRARDAGLRGRICNHTFRATGITAYLENGGTLEMAQAIAAHESPRTTKLYDRTADAVTLDEVERIVL